MLEDIFFASQMDKFAYVTKFAYMQILLTVCKQYFCYGYA